MNCNCVRVIELERIHNTPEQEESCIGFFYDIETNHFIDEDGFPVWDIYDYISPKELYLFRRDKEYTIIYNWQKKMYIELFYPEDDD